MKSNNKQLQTLQLYNLKTVINEKRKSTKGTKSNNRQPANIITFQPFNLKTFKPGSTKNENFRKKRKPNTDFLPTLNFEPATLN